MYEFKLPDVGEGIHEAVIASWLIKVGDEVTLDQPIVEIETDKALVQIPSPVAGIIAELPINEGVTAHVGDVIVIFQQQGQTAPKPQSKPDKPAAASTKSAKPVSPATVGIAGPGQRVLAAPAVRKRALELGIDLQQIKGSAAAGRVTMADLETYAEQPRPKATTPAKPAAPAPVVRTATESTQTEPLKGLRKRIAERMSEAWQMPHVTSFDEINVKKLVKLRKTLNEMLAEEDTWNQRLSYLPFVIKAVVLALKKYPYFNASLNMAQETITHHNEYHIGIATAIEEGLLVPVIRNADQLTLLEIQHQLSELTELARERRLPPDQLTGSTFTITNYGSVNGQAGTPIINPPESAILGCGKIENKPLVIEDKIKIRPVLPLALSFDHRLHDGASAAHFLVYLKSLLSDPSRLFLHF